MDNTIQIIISAILFFLIDLLWVAYLAKDAYKAQIQLIQGTPMKINSTLLPLVYLLIGMGIVYLVQPRLVGIERNSLDYFYNSMIWGGLLGLITYGVFDLTNYSIFKDWDPVLGLKDTLWGTFLTGLTTYLLGRLF